MDKTIKSKAGNKSNTNSPYAYHDGRSFVAGMKQQSAGIYTKQSYFRSGFPKLYKFEQKIAGLIGVPSDQLYFMSSGMSAIVAALEITSPSKGDVVIHGTAEYSKIDAYINEDLQDRGVKAIAINPSQVKEIDNLLKKLINNKSRVKSIIFETVGNGPQMPVLDIKAFLKLKNLQRLDPLIILDKTFPTNSVINLSKIIDANQNLKIIGIESATKFYLRNQDLGGIVFTPHEELRKKLLNKRTRMGLTPSISTINNFSNLSLSKKQFDAENKLTMHNSCKLANACWESNELNKKLYIGYPNLPTHPQYGYIKTKYPQGIAPLFFIQPLPHTNMTAEELFYKLEKLGAFVGMEITESFGFKNTTVSHNTRYNGYIRIAGGLETKKEVQLMAERLQSAISKL